MQIVFTRVGYIKLDHLSHKMYYTNCVKKLKYVKFLTVYCCSPFANMSPIIVWLFLELWDTVYLLVTSEYVFVAVLWEWVCYQMISHPEIQDSIVW